MAAFYDKLMYDVDYISWVNYLEKIFQKFEVKPVLIADLGCGTGNISLEFARRNKEVIGIDISEEMLGIAKEKANRENIDILLLNQDMTKFELYGTVDCIISTMDSINHITNTNKLRKTFDLVNNYLNPGGLFVFDINTHHKLKNILADNVFYDVNEECSYIWQCSYNNKTNCNTFDLTVFLRSGELYRRRDDSFDERAYTEEEMTEYLNAAGLQVMGVFHELTFKPPKKNSERLFFVARK